MDNADNGGKGDAASASIRTEDLLSQPSTISSPGVRERELELKIHKLGWSGSNYDDYE